MSGRDVITRSSPSALRTLTADIPARIASLDGERRRAWLAPAALLAGLTAAAVFFYTRGGHLSFYVDEWGFMLHRRGLHPHVFLDAQNGHLVAVPILIYKVLFSVFGVRSYVPYRLVALAIELSCAGLFFALVRRRGGDGIALVATVSVLFLGPAWEPLVSPVGMIALTSLAAGLGMLLALDADSRRGDAAACVLLAISLASFSYGTAFAAAAAVDVLLRPGARRRIWLVIVPSLLYGLWLLHYENSPIVAANIPNVPRAVADSIGDDLVSVTGLYRTAGVGGGPYFDATYAPPLAFAFIVLVGLSLRRTPPRRGPRLYACLVLAVMFWVEIALVLDAGRTTTSSRYIYPGVVLLLLACAEMGRGRRLGSRGLAVLAIAVALVVGVVQIPDLNEGAAALNGLGRFDRAELAALDLARGAVSPTFTPEPPPPAEPGYNYIEAVDAASYFAAVDAFGSPAYTVAQLRRAPARPRAAADEVLAQATGLRAQTALGPGSGARCGKVAPAAGGSSVAVMTVSTDGFFVRPRQSGPLELRLRRFGPNFREFAVRLPPVPGDAGTAVPIHADSADVPWHVQISGIQKPVTFCALG